MIYFKFEENEEVAIKHWNDNQFNLCDIVLSLTDNAIIYGGKIYALFLREEILDLMRFFICDFVKIKKDLGINGKYVERNGDLFSYDFNPKRSKSILIYDLKTMKDSAKKIYFHLLEDLKAISESIN